MLVFFFRSHFNQFITSQSQPRQPSVRVGQPSATPNHQPATTAPPETEEPPSPTSSTSSSQHQKEVAEEVGASQEPKAAPPSAVVNAQKATAPFDTIIQTTPTEAQPMQLEAVPSSSADEDMHQLKDTNPPPKETAMEESIRVVTRGRLRKARSAGNR